MFVLDANIDKSKKIFSNQQLFFLLWPLLTEQLLNVCVGMIDVVMVASLGETAVSGVSLIDALNQLLIQFLAALTAGGTVVCSQCIGKKDMQKAAHASAQLIAITIGGAIILSAVSMCAGRTFLQVIFGNIEPAVMDNAYIYFMITALSFPFLALYNSSAALFRATGNSAISMKVSLLMNGMNVIGNAFCIFILHMGVAGVAVPTLISRMTAACLLFSLLQKPENTVRIQRASDLKPDRPLIIRILSIGIPGGIESSIFQLGKVMLQSLVAGLGTAAIASYAVAGNLVTFLYLPGNALGLGLTTVVGQCVGAKEAQQAKNYTKLFILLDYIFLAIISTTLLLGRYTWIGFYNLSPEAVKMAAGLVFSHSVAMIIWPLAFVTPYALRAANDAKFTMVVSILCIWLFRVALAYFFVKVMHKDIQYVWYAMYIDWVFRVIVWMWRFKGYTRRIEKL